MKKSDYIVKSLINATGVFVYILAVAYLLFNGKNIFGEVETIFVPVFMMLLLVISASVTGLLVLGKPIHLYLSNFKKEAFTLLFATLSWLVFFALAITAILIFLR